ncbi:MAG: TolC family protein [bacterium]
MNRLLLLGMGCFLISCATTSTNSTSDTLASERRASQSASDSTPTSWLTEFHDPALEQIVSETLSYQHDLKSAAPILAALEKPAPFSIAAQESRWLPCSFLMTGSDSFPSDSPLNSWEREIWTRLLWETPFSASDAQAARLSIAAQTAKSWFEAVEAKLQLQLADEMLQNASKETQSALERFRSGLDSATHVHMARSRYNDRTILVERALMNYRQTALNLETLLGRPPTAELEAAASLPVSNASLPLEPSLSTDGQKVEEALAQEKFFAQRELNFKAAAESSWAAYEQTLESYKKGLASFFNVLKSHQDALAVKSDWLASQREHLENRVNAYLASNHPQAVPSPKLETQPVESSNK